MSAVHFSDHERKKSAAHFLLDERVSKERKKSAENNFSKKMNIGLIEILNFPFINCILPIKGYKNEQKFRLEYNLAKEKESTMSASIFDREYVCNRGLRNDFEASCSCCGSGTFVKSFGNDISIGLEMTFP